MRFPVRGTRVPLLFFLAAWLLSAPAALSAQETAAYPVTGRVVGPDGIAVPNARVVLGGPTPAASDRQTRSTPDGTFAFPGVPAGRYVLRVDVPGFAAAVRDVIVNATLEPIAVSLSLAAVTQSVTVQAAAVSSVGRTDVPARDQPISVDTIPSQQLETFAVNDLVAALQTLPNVNAYNEYGVYEYYSFRGFSDSVQTVDGVRNEGNRVRTQLSNVERVEVLKGPASVLYGTDAIGATVNIVLKKPTPDPVYDGSVSFGSWGTARATLGASGRIAGPRLLYRLDVGVDRSDGFRHDGFEKFNVTPTVTWRGTDRDLVEVRYAANRNDLSGDGGIPLQALPDGTEIIPDVPRDRRYNTPADFALSVDHNVRIGYTRVLTDRLTARAAFSGRKFDDEYWVAESLWVTPPSTVNREFLYFKHARRPYFGQAELSGRVRFGLDHDILAGLELQRYRSRTTRSVDASAETTPIDLFNPVETHVTWTSFPVSRYDYTRNRTNAVYVQDAVTLGTRLKAVAGVRFDGLTRRTNNNPVNNGIETPVDAVRRESSALTWRAGVVYQPVDRIDVYAQYATAFRPNFNLQADGSTIDPETGRQIEVGQRFRASRARIEITTSAFQIEKRNIALARPGGVFDLAGRIRSRGAEAEIEWRPSALSRLAVGYGFTNARYLDYVTTSASFSGHVRPRAPKHTLSVGGSVAFANGLALAGHVQGRSRQFVDDANTLALDSYAVADASVSYTRGRVQYSLALTNLTDTEYWASTLGNSQLYPGEPLRVMATLRLRTR